MSDQNVHDLISAFVPVLSALALGLFIYFKGKASDLANRQNAREAATRVEEVKADLHASNAEKNAKLDNIAQLSEKTHALVNSAMGAQLRLTAETARALADVDPASVNVTAANLAERLYREHQVKQAAADAGDFPGGAGAGFPGEAPPPGLH
jgi:ribonuclease HII